MNELKSEEIAFCKSFAKLSDSKLIKLHDKLNKELSGRKYYDPDKNTISRRKIAFIALALTDRGYCPKEITVWEKQ